MALHTITSYRVPYYCASGTVPYVPIHSLPSNGSEKSESGYVNCATLLMCTLADDKWQMFAA